MGTVAERARAVLSLRSSAPRSATQRFGAAFGVVALAYALQMVVWPYIPPSPHLFFYPAVFVAARIGGSRAGYLATVLSTLAIAYGFLPPEGILVVAKASDILDLGIFFAVCFGISAAVGQLNDAVLQGKHDAALARAAKQSTDATWSMVAHDLRQPLSVITMGSSELGRRAATAPDMEKMLQLIQRSTDRARELVDDALDAMRAAEGRLVMVPAPCDVRELCAHALDAVALSASRKGLTLESDVASPRAIACDQPRLQQVLTNILGNAVKFTPPGGVVSLYVDETEDGQRFTVRDTGPGIAAGDLEAIFTKFWSGSGPAASTGLGLWIASAILEAHGSRLTVESSVGSGTTFAFVLPFADVSESASTAALRASSRAS